MAVDTFETVRDTVADGVEQTESFLDQFGEPIQHVINGAFGLLGETGRDVKTFLNGTWLGHPLHPVLTDVPIGSWTSGLFLDILGFRRAADWAIGIGSGMGLSLLLGFGLAMGLQRRHRMQTA